MDLTPDEASIMLERWMAQGQPLGVLFFGSRSTLVAVARMTAADRRRVSFTAETTAASFLLKDATFKFETMPIWPHWPYPPIVKVQGMQIWFPNLEYLFVSAARESLSLPALKQLLPSQR